MLPYILAISAISASVIGAFYINNFRLKTGLTPAVIIGKMLGPGPVGAANRMLLVKTKYGECWIWVTSLEFEVLQVGFTGEASYTRSRLTKHLEISKFFLTTERDGTDV